MTVWGLLELLLLVPPEGSRSSPAAIVLGIPLLLSGTFVSVRAVVSHARVARGAVVDVGCTRTRRTASDQIDRVMVVDVDGSAEEFWDLPGIRTVQPLLELRDGTRRDLPALAGLA